MSRIGGDNTHASTSAQQGGGEGETASRRVAIEITRLVKNNGPLTKRIYFTLSGGIANDSSDCCMARGRMERLPLDDWRDFAPLIEATARNEAYALGHLRDGLPDSILLVTKKELGPGTAARTKDNILYLERESLALLDFDTKGMPQHITKKLDEAGGFVATLSEICPAIGEAGFIRRLSTSAGVYNPSTGEDYRLTRGEHVYLLIENGKDARRFLYALHDRAWLAGFGWYIVGTAGSLLERSLVDRMVCDPARLVFEAPPDLEPPLGQHRREATVHDGPALDTFTAQPDLSATEKNRLKRRKAESAKALERECAIARAAFMAGKVEAAVAAGMDPAKARVMAEQWGSGLLTPGAILEFDDPALGTTDVADVLAGPKRYVGETLADPIEGVAFGRNCAILQERDGKLSVFSFAHGGIFYRLQAEPENEDKIILKRSAPYDNAGTFIERKFHHDGKPTLLYQQRTFYGWETTHYAVVPEKQMRGELWKFLANAFCQDKQGALFPFAPNKTVVADVLEALAAHAQLRGVITFPYWRGNGFAPASEIISFNNGLLHFPTRKLYPHTSSLRNVFSLDFPFNPDFGEPEKWIEFLNQIWPKDQEAINTLQEMFGLCLTSDTSFQKIFLLIGPMRCGKGTIARILREMLGGHANVAGPTLGSLGGDFGLQPLINKPLAIISDARISPKTDVQVISERLLSISGEDPIDVARKYLGDPWRGGLPTRFLILTNLLPKLTDASGALVSRFVILQIAGSFYGREDRGLFGKLAPELPGILNWSLEGLDRLRKRGHFIMPKSSMETLADFQNLSSPVGEFSRDKCEIRGGFSVPVDDLFGAWESWCRDHGRHFAGNVQSFGVALRAAHPAITQKRVGPRGAQVRIYEGIRLITPENAPEEARGACDVDFAEPRG